MQSPDRWICSPHANSPTLCLLDTGRRVGENRQPHCESLQRQTRWLLCHPDEAGRRSVVICLGAPINYQGSPDSRSGEPTPCQRAATCQTREGSIPQWWRRFRWGSRRLGKNKCVKPEYSDTVKQKMAAQSDVFCHKSQINWKKGETLILCFRASIMQRTQPKGPNIATVQKASTNLFPTKQNAQEQKTTVFICQIIILWQLIWLKLGNNELY